MSDTFTCAKCGGTFDKMRTDEEALEEMRDLHGDIPEEERLTICEDCFQELSEFFGW